VMEDIYRRFDQSGVTDNEVALQALLDGGLQQVEPDPAEVVQWRDIVNQSRHELAAQGKFDGALLERMQVLIDEFRGRTSE
jgi:hypothetical protein